MAGGDTDTIPTEGNVWNTWQRPFVSSQSDGTLTVTTGATDSSAVTESNDIWQIWLNASVTSSATTGSIFEDPWPAWNNSSTGDSFGSSGVFGKWIVSQEQYRERTKEQKAAARRREREYQTEQQRRAKARKCASSRAHKILGENLDRSQRRCLAKLGYFDIQVHGRTFRIHNNKYIHNVFELDAQGKPVREFCAHTSHACPQSDHALAQKLLLENDPEEFFRIANIWDIQGNRRIVSSSRANFVLPPQPQAGILHA